jgi:hypothetical protein
LLRCTIYRSLIECPKLFAGQRKTASEPMATAALMANAVATV